DEVFGYFPPVSNPPSKTPLLRLLKQARAFGLGVVLATQNPVDLDYRGLSNTGTWLIGRLQTERDQMRVMDGLQGGALAGHMNPERLAPLLAALESRSFLLHNVHEREPVVFKSRWALSYLRGPLTRDQIKQLGSRVEDTASPLAGAPQTIAETPRASGRPSLPPDIPAYFVRSSGAGQEVIYRPHAFAQMEIYYSRAKYRVDLVRSLALATPLEDGPVPLDWDASLAFSTDTGNLEREALPGARFGDLPPVALKIASYKKWQKDLSRWVKVNRPVILWQYKPLKLTSTPEESEGDFRSRIAMAGREKRDLAVEKLRRKYAQRFQTMKNRLLTAEQAIAREEEQAKSRQMDTVISFGSAILGAFLGRKAVSARSASRMGTAMKSAGRMRKEKMDVARAQERADAVRQQMAELESRLQEDIHKIARPIDAEEGPLEEIRIAPKLSDINMDIFGLAWLPYRKNDRGHFVPDWDRVD
ncbi:MAG: ATP-binding protein, partial [Desulfobacterales bacterium]